jgi:SAM-dependent methyltransferase
MSGFSFEDLFDPEEYLYFLEDTLRAEDTPRQCDFLESALRLQPASRVLDLGCGHGRHAIELASRGHHVLGVDLIAGFLQIAAREAEARGVEVGLVQADMRAFTAEAAFDAVVCLFDAFGFFTDDDDRRVLANALSALVPGGHLLLDLRPREVLARLPASSVLDKGNGDLMIDRHHFDVESGRLVDRRTTIRAGKVREVAFSVRLYSFTELRSILRDVGFEVAGFYGGYDGAPATVESSRMLVLARKP